MKYLVFLMINMLLYSVAINAEENPSKPKVSFVSIMGSSVKLQNVGYTVFENKDNNNEAKDWGIDQYINNAGNNILRNSSFIEYVKTDITEEMLKGIVPEFRFLRGTVLPEEDLQVLSVIGKENGLDYLLVAIPVGYGDIIGRTNQSINGYGVYYRNFPVAAFVSAHISLVDISDEKVVRHGKIVGYEKLDLKAKELSEKEKRSIRAEFEKREAEAEEDLFFELADALSPRPHHTPESFHQITSNERKYIEHKVKNVIDKNIEKAFKDALSKFNPPDEPEEED